MTRNFECPGVDFNQLLVHHADRIVTCSAGIQTRAVRHGAGLNPGDFGHVIGGDDGHGRWNHVSMEIEIHDVCKVTVGREIQRRRKHPQSHPAKHSVVAGGIFPERAKRLPVRDGHVVILFVRRDCKSMRAVDVDRHDARRKLVIDCSATGPESYGRNLICSLGCNVDIIGGVLGK